MPLSVVQLARTQRGAFIVRSTSSQVPLLVSGVEDMKALFGMDEEEKHS